MKRATHLGLCLLSCWLLPRLLSAQAPVADKSAAVDAGQLRKPADEAEAAYWLRNMWLHRYSKAEMRQVTGMSAKQLASKLTELGFDKQPPPLPQGLGDLGPLGGKPGLPQLVVLPYPGGRHPRIGFLDGAINPQRETKLSVFCPWDDESYAVLDVPEAIWSNLGLTYLAHTHIDTIWTKQQLKLKQLEWTRHATGALEMERTLPNGIAFGTVARPQQDHLLLEMWLTNGSNQKLTDLRVQNCVMLKAVRGFNAQTNENKLFRAGYALAHSADRKRWIISAWDPVHRTWGNAPCPCLHSDPKFPDCAPGETRFLRGWFSFYEGEDIDGELQRIERTGWRTRAAGRRAAVGMKVLDGPTQSPIGCRVYAQNLDTKQWFLAESTASNGSAIPYSRRLSDSSVEVHTTVSPHPFQWKLPAGDYRFRVERGKEYLPHVREANVPAGVAQVDLGEVSLTRWIDMNALGWYPGDTHVHRAPSEMANLMEAEDLNVAFPLTYWVRDSRESPASSGRRDPDVADFEPRPQVVGDSRVFYPVNTEYEIFTVDGKRHTQGAVFVLNHRTPLEHTAPPTTAIARSARQQGGLLDFDKHSWNWSLMIAPVMKVDLFELSNNHHWRTGFGFPQWTIDNAPDWPEIERDEQGLTEAGWTAFGLQTYYSLLNCGLRMRVTAGTASGVHPVPLGYGRVYVHCGPKFDYPQWIEGLNQGRSFVTQGPMLDLRFNGELPGHTWKRTDDAPLETIEITGGVFAQESDLKLHVIQNGRVVHSEPCKPKQHRVSIRVPLPEASCWLAVYCEGTRDPLPVGGESQKLVFAHTNPVFIDVPDKPVQPRRERVAFFIQRMEEELKRNRGVLSEAALAEFERAKRFYESKLTKPTKRK